MTSMNRRLAHSALFAALAGSALAAGHTASTDSYAADPAPAIPGSGNLFAGRVPIAVSNASAGEEQTSTSPSVLTDGVGCDAAKSKPYFYCIGNDAVLLWELPQPANIREFRIYAAWGDENRNDIAVSSIRYRALASGEWSVIGGSTFASSQSADVNTIGEAPLTTRDRVVSFAADEGAWLATNATAVEITFGQQDHDYGGYLEIQALGESVAFDANGAYAVVDEANSSGFTKKTFGPYTTYTFASDGAIAFSQAGKADVLLVGGGAGGGMTMGGGGGGGGVREFTDYVFPAAQSFPVTVGAGGAGGAAENANGGNGGLSSIGGLVVYGGGGGAGWGVTTGSSSATGGGNAQGAQTPAAALPHMFGAGGAAYGSVAGGGGGAGAAGGYASAEAISGKAGPGGAGVASSITGRPVVYGGGGGGGAGGVNKNFLENMGVTVSLGGDGGLGGGGRGADQDSGLSGSNGVDGLGGGGGGGGYDPTTHGGNGGNGVVIVRTTDPNYAGADVAADLESVVADSPTGATIDWSVDYFAAAQPAALRLEYGTVSNSLDKVATLSATASAAGAGSESLSGVFAESTTYYARLAIYDAANQEWVPGETVLSFKTGSFGSRPGRAEIAGLWQRYIGNRWDVSTPVLDENGQGSHGILLSPAAAYINDGTHWTGRNPDGTTSECWWGGKQTYAYAGFMYFEDATYTFGISIDDTGLVKIDGVEVARADSYNASAALALGTWTPPRGEGWYPIEIRVGNDGGGWGAIGGFGGVCYNTTGYTAKDTSANWKPIVDPGDGTLLRIQMEEALEIAEARIGGAAGSRKLFADIESIPEIAGASLYVAFTSAPVGYDASAYAWTSAGTVAGGTHPVDVALPAGARYAVFSAVSGEDRLWTRFVALDEVAAVPDGLPVANLVEVAVSSGGVLTANLSVRDLGGAASVQVTFSALNVETGHAVETVFADVTDGTRVFTLDGLVPDRHIVVTATVSNVNGSVAADGSGEVIFNLPAATGGTYYKAGLLQAKTGAWNAETAESNFDNSVIPVEVVPGTVMADVQATESNYGDEGHFYVNPATGTTNAWNKQKTTWSYKGEIYLEAGTTYVFGKYLDDGAVLIIDGRKLIENGNYKDFIRTTYTTEQTGWHTFLAYVYDGSGGKGPTGGDWGPQMGLAWNDTGLTDGKPSVSGWRTIRDPGDMSVLRAPFEFVPVTISSATPTANGYDATVSIGEGNRRGTPSLYACYGETCGGGDPAQWPHVVLVQTNVAADVSEIAYSGFSGLAAGEKVNYLRFRLVADDGIDSWSECLYVAPRTGPVLMPGVTIDAQSGLTARFVGGLIQTGSGPTAEVVLEIATEEDLANARTISFGQQSVAAPFTNDVAVVAGETYFWRLKAIASDNDFDMTQTASFTVPSAAAFDGALSVASSQNHVTFSANLIDLGAGGETTVSLLGGASAEDLATVGEPVVKDETGAVSFAVDVPFLDGTYYAKAIAVNIVGQMAFTAETAVATVTLVDNTTYTWKEGVTEGAWTNPANWTASINNPYALYPNSSKARANFKNCTVPTVVTISGTVVVDIIQNANNNALDLTFRRDPDAETSRIQCWATWWDGFGDSRITIDSVYYYCHDGKYMNLAYLKVTNGATFETAQETQWHKGGAVLEVSNGSRWQQTDWTLSMTGDGSKFILDNSTFYSRSELWCPRNSGGANNVIEVRGTNPVFDCTGFVAGRDSQGESGPTIVFVVPEGGYVAPPFSRANGGSFNPKLPMNIVVDPASPALHAGDKRVVTKLIDYPKGTIQSPNNISLAARPGMLSFRYTYGTANAAEPASEGDLPTGLWLDIPIRPTILILQ